MKYPANTLRRREDDNVFRCVVVDDPKTWTSFSYKEFKDGEEVVNKTFSKMWEALDHYNAIIYELMKPWMNKPRS